MAELVDDGWPALEAALAELVLGPPIDLGDDAALERLLVRHRVADDDVAHLLATDRARLGIYRKLVRGNLREVLTLAMPRATSRLAGLFDEYFDAYLADVAPRSHVLRDVNEEFLAWCAPRFADDARVPPYLPELARHEAAHIDVSARLARPAAAEPEPLAIDRGVRFIEACRLMRHTHAIHHLPDDPADRTVPPARPTTLLVYRSPQHRVRYLELTELAGDLVERLLTGEALGEALRRAAEARGATLDEALLTRTAEVLADLAERGVILGAA